MGSNKLFLKHPAKLTTVTVMGLFWPSAANDEHKYVQACPILFGVTPWKTAIRGVLSLSVLLCLLTMQNGSDCNHFEIQPEQDELSWLSFVITTISWKAISPLWPWTLLMVHWKLRDLMGMQVIKMPLSEYHCQVLLLLLAWK